MMNGNRTLNLEALPHYQKRVFVPEGTNFKDLQEVRALYDVLLKRDIDSAAALRQWVLDRSELESALDQYGSILYIRMTCQTDDPLRAEDYRYFIETIAPAVRPLDDSLNRRYLDLWDKYPLEEIRYMVYTRAIRTDVELFVDRNVELQTQVDLLSQEYQSLCGAMTVDFQGKERTLPEMGKFLLDPDRELREKAWRLSAQRRQRESARLDALFNEMLLLRNQIALNAGFQNFRDYKFKALHRFDYTPQDCKAYHRTVERLVVPVWKAILLKRKEQMGLKTLRPWDTSVDPLGRVPLRPFGEVGELIDGCTTIFSRVDQTLGAQFARMIQDNLLDLQSRKGKAPGGYQSTLNEARVPFIFMNAVGVDSDVRTLLHEGGHAFHALACASDPFLAYRHGPMEFNEVASMGMELLADQFLDTFYSPEDVIRSRQKHLEDVVFILAWVAIVDAFQHWIYEHPVNDVRQRQAQWLELHKRYSGGVIDWEGLEEEHACLWHQQLHIFEVPFYYIEYGIAQLGALQLWLNSRQDWMKALGQYRKALSLGGSRPLPELFSTAGLCFDFSEKTMAPLLAAVAQELSADRML